MMATIPGRQNYKWADQNEGGVMKEGSTDHALRATIELRLYTCTCYLAEHSASFLKFSLNIV